MSAYRLWHSGVLGAAILTTMLSVGASARAPRAANMNFDGPWSVVVITEQGTCDRAYRYGVEIQNGRVFYRGGAGVNIFGQVSPRGQVSVQVQQGDQQAVGTGRLTEVSGGGRWSGTSPSQQCAGHWTAERREQ
jgi:hypothetical protein